MHEYLHYFFGSEQRECEAYRAEHLRAVDQDDITYLHEARQYNPCVSEQKSGVFAILETFLRDSNIRRMLVKFYADNLSMRQCPRKQERTLAARTTRLEYTAHILPFHTGEHKEHLGIQGAFLFIRNGRRDRLKARYSVPRILRNIFIIHKRFHHTRSSQQSEILERAMEGDESIRKCGVGGKCLRSRNIGREQFQLPPQYDGSFVPGCTEKFRPLVQ